jgi:hypothetical protein
VLLLTIGLTLVSACSGDDAPAAPSTTASASADAGPPPTTTPPQCDELANRYLDAFFALGAGTPEDAEATTVELPVDELQAIVGQARQAGCAEFTEVACSAWAELEAQGLEATNGEPPASC